MTRKDISPESSPSPLDSDTQNPNPIRPNFQSHQRNKIAARFDLVSSRVVITYRVEYTQFLSFHFGSMVGRSVGGKFAFSRLVGGKGVYQLNRTMVLDQNRDNRRNSQHNFDLTKPAGFDSPASVKVKVSSSDDGRPNQIASQHQIEKHEMHGDPL